MPKGTRRKMVL